MKAKSNIKFYIFICWIVINILLSCQTKTTPNCTITYKAGTNKFTVPCRDSIFYSEFEIDRVNESLNSK